MIYLNSPNSAKRSQRIRESVLRPDKYPRLSTTPWNTGVITMDFIMGHQWTLIRQPKVLGSMKRRHLMIISSVYKWLTSQGWISLTPSDKIWEQSEATTRSLTTKEAIQKGVKIFEWIQVSRGENPLNRDDLTIFL